METHPRDKSAAIALNLMPGIGSRTFRKLLESLPGLEGVGTASEGLLAACGLNGDLRARLRETDLEAVAERERREAARQGVTVVTFFDEGYPDLLRQIADPPPVLYYRGTLGPAGGPSVAVVGSRQASPYGLVVAEGIGRDLAAAGFNVVSGLARGIDAAAHAGALAAGGRTTAVFGSGLDVVYPSHHRRLAARVEEAGACISEYPLGTRPDRHTFPRRNRIISGLCLATVVVEAAARSGALITAEFAVEEGREVFAVPGQVGSSRSEGCHRLIKEGAHLYERLDDLLQEIAPLLRGTAVPSPDPSPALKQPLPPGEEALLSLLESGPLVLDELAGRSGLAPERVLSLMLSLELRGEVRQFPGKRFVKIPGDS